MKSLPVGSKFAIIGFGAQWSSPLPRYESLRINNKELIESTEVNANIAIASIDGMMANMAGTAILEPLQYA